MSRGIGVVSGSSTVYFQATDDGAFIVGRDLPMVVQISGSLNLRVNGALGSNRWLRLTGSDGTAIWSTMSASVINNVALGLITSSDVQGAINELQNHINQVVAGGGSSITFSDGVNNSVILANGSTVTITGSTSILTSQYAAGKYTLNLAQNLLLTGNAITVGPFTSSNGIVIQTNGITVQGGTAALLNTTITSLTASNGLLVQTGSLSVNQGGFNVLGGNTILQAVTAGPLTASNGIVVSTNGITVSAGNSSFQTVSLSSLTSSANVYAQTLVITGSTTLGTSGSQVNTTILNGMFQVPIFTQGNVPSPFVNNPFAFVGYMFYLQGPGSGTFPQGDKWYHNEKGTWFPSMFFSGS